MSTLLVNVDARGVATLTLNRPDVHNAFDDGVINALIDAMAELRERDDVRVLVLSAAGKSFSAGADLGWMKRMASYSEADNLADAKQLAILMADLYSFPCPTLAVVQGAAFGGALGLISCCDIAIATDNASFCLSEVKLGLAPAVISPYVIQAIGPRAASRYFLTAERFNAATARDLGLVHEVATSEALSGVAEQLLTTLLANGPHALRATKKLIQTVRPASGEELFAYTTELIAKLRVSAEGQDGLSAFFDRRPPAWLQKEPQ